MNGAGWITLPDGTRLRADTVTAVDVSPAADGAACNVYVCVGKARHLVAIAAAADVYNITGPLLAGIEHESRVWAKD